MIYPLVSEYVDAILNSEENFDQLSDLTPVLDGQGKPIISNGNYSVVFKMVNRITGSLYAIKCFTKEQSGRDNSYKEISEELEYVNKSYVTSVQYLENELFVYSSITDKTEFPVVKMDWVEGVNLAEFLHNNHSPEEIYSLAFSFSEMALWLISQPFSHGDIKPDNIIVRDDSSLVMVDYDGMFLPSMKGQPARELGTPDYRHPFRATHLYDEHIDDFSIIVILLSLMLIYEDGSLLNNNMISEGLLFSERDYYDLDKCDLYKTLKNRKRENVQINNLFVIFEKCLEQGFLEKADIYRIKLPEFSNPSIIQGKIAASVITEILWNFSRGTYIRDLNLTDNLLRFTSGKQEVKFVTHNKKIYVGTTIHGNNYMYGYTYAALKKLLVSLGTWDKSIENKFMILNNEIQLSSPKLMLVSTKTYIDNLFPELSNKVTISISGQTLIISLLDNFDNMENQHFIYNMLSNDVFQKNSKKFGLKKVLVIEALTGVQLSFDVNNL